MKRLVLALLLGGCGGGAPSADECNKVADHILEILAAPHGQDKESLKASETWTKQLKAKDPSRQALLDMCSKQLKSSHTECLLAATDEKGLAKCLGAGGG